MRSRFARPILALALLSCALNPTIGRATAADDDRERAVMERFRSVLEKAPRRGTALDRVYGFHVERGELDALIQSYRDRATKDPNDGQGWLLLGLVESQRGRDAAAVAAFRSAEEKLPDDALPAYYLGQALVLVGQPDAAAEAFERALTRKLSRNDLLEIFQALGRVHQRARRDEQALAVWTRLEKLFPDDPRVQEQIASTLAEESRLEPALARYEALTTLVRDPYRRVRFRLEAADLKVKLGRQVDALRDYEGLLAALDPASWLSREVRRKIEDVFQRDDDQAGLAKYYEGWLAKSPEDIDAMGRLGKALAAQGRSAEARSWFDKALKLAPSNRALRLALIEQLSRERKVAEAASQYEAMAKLEPNNPDLIRDWGRMLLRDNSRAEPDRKAAASAVWRKLVEARPDDPSAAAQVADLLRQAGQVDEAIALYQKAIALAPGSPQYREYLGEYYHQLKRPADALAAWRGLAEGAAKTPLNLERLGEVLANFGYKSEAIEALDEAIRLDPNAYATRLRQAGLLLDAARFDAAQAQLDAAEPLAADEEHRDEVLGKRISVDEAAGRLAAKVESLKAAANGPKAGDPSTWLRLARYLEAARRPVEATSAGEKAVGLDGKSITARATLGRLYEATGRYGEAAEASRALAAIDRRSRSEHLTKVADLEARLGRKDEALRAGREVLAASPGNAEALQFYSNLCFQLGEPEEGLNALRRAARSNESDVAAMVNLGEALAREFRTEEAIELFWKAFEKSDDLDARLGFVAKLAELHLRRNQFDRLTARLERLQGEDGKRREGTFFLAKAHASLGDFGTARHQLEGLLDGNARDTALLKQLSKLAEDEGDFPAALKFQQQLHEVAPDGESARRLGQLAIKAGDIEAVEALWTRAADATAGGGQDLAQTLTALNGLASNGKFEAVLATTTRLLRDDPNNWELLYREAKTLETLGRLDEAASRYRAILDLRRDDEEVSAIIKAARRMGGRSGNTPLRNEQAGVLVRVGPGATRIAGYFGLIPGYPTNLVNAWNPGDYGLARMAALAFELARARKLGTEAEWLDARRQATEKAPTDPRTAWDNFYVAILLGENRSMYDAARTLVRAVGHDSRADYAFLYLLYYRDARTSVQAARVIIDSGPEIKTPLPREELDLARDALRTLIREKSPLLTAPIVESVMTELKRAGRLEEFEPDYRTLVDSPVDHSSIFFAGRVAGERGDLDALRKVYQAFYRLPVGTRSPYYASQPYFVTTPQGVQQLPEMYLTQAIKVLADSKRYGEILGLVDEELAAIRTPGRVLEREKAARIPLTTPLVNRYPAFGTTNAVQLLDYPTPNRYLDPGPIVLLRAAFSYLKRDGRVGDLTAHLKQVAAGASTDPSAERYARLAYSAVLWWNDDRDGATRELARAVELTPGDVDLKLLLTDVRSLRKEPEEALALLDSIEAVDQDATRRREILALRLAVQAGKADRARQAAERLFGLRLDSPTQVQLAAQMQQLGMHDLADAVLARARRQVGNSPDALLELMGQYRRQGNLDAASQIAIDVLRRSTGQALRMGVVDDPSQRMAIEVLASSGKLREMIEKVEGQVKTSPNSVPLRQTLVAYYRASGQLDKLKQANEAILKLRPDDTALRMQVATQLAQAGDLPAALDHYRAVFQHDPSMLSVYSSAIFATFQQANKTDELVKLLDQVGLKTFDDPNSIRTLLGPMLKDPKTFDQGVSLFKKAWDAYPNDRMLLLSAVTPIAPFWDRPESYDLVKEACLSHRPGTAAWAGIGETIAVGGWDVGGKVVAPTTRLLDVATRLNKLDDLAASIEASLARLPGWRGGSALLAAVRLRQGRVDEGRTLLEPLLADPDSRPPFAALIVLGQEVREIPSCAPLAIALYERAMLIPQAMSMASLYMKASAPWSLARLYRQAGRTTEALALARQVEESFRAQAMSGTPGNALVAYRQVNSLSNLGMLYLDLGDHANALRVYDELLGSPDDILAARGYDTRDTLPPVNSLIGPTIEGVDRALNGLTRETLPLALETLIKPGNPRPVDVRLVIQPRAVDQATIRSLLVAALDLAARDPATFAKVKADLDAIATAKPGDFEAKTALALVAESAGLAPLARALDRQADETPLSADARGRDEASRRLGLWLVARRCWEHDSTVEVGDKLADRALEAARRLPDLAWAMAMLRELGRRSLDKGDRPAAEARFAALLDLIEQDPLAQNPTAPPTRPAPVRPSPVARTRVTAFTVGRFRQASEFAALAADAGLADLSLKAVRDALKGGPPVVPVSLMREPGTVLRTAASAVPVETPPDPTIVLVESKLVALDALWTRAKVPTEAAYEVIRDAVLPPGRPTEVFSYDPSLTRQTRPSTADAPSPPGEVARLLARRAKVAGKLEDLRRKVDERKSYPPAKEAARRLLAAIEEVSREKD